MPSCSLPVKDILRACVAVACNKIEEAGFVPFIKWDWFRQGSVYIELLVPVEAASHRHRRLGITIRISNHAPHDRFDASWSIHPGSDTDIDRLVARARRIYQGQRNDARSKAAAKRQHCDHMKRKSFKRGRR